MRINLVIFWSLVLFAFSCKNETEPEKVNQNVRVTLQTGLDSISYALGINMANSVKKQGLEQINLDALHQGFYDVMYMDNDSVLLMSLTESNRLIQVHFQQLFQQKLDNNLAEGRKFLEKNKKNTGIITLASGLQYRILRQGTGKNPKITDRVEVVYEGRLIDGTVFDSSEGEAVAFALNRVIPGWTEILQLMKPGDKYQVFIPTELAYGKRVRPGGKIEANMALVFDIELINLLENTDK